MSKILDLLFMCLYFVDVAGTWFVTTILGWPLNVFLRLFRFRPKKPWKPMIRISTTMDYDTAESIVEILTEDYIVTRDRKVLDFLRALYHYMGREDEFRALTWDYPPKHNNPRSQAAVDWLAKKMDFVNERSF